MTSFLFDFWPYLAAAGTAITALIAAFVKGSQREKQKQKLKEAKADVETHKRIDAIPPVDPTDQSSIIDGLRRHAKRKRGG